MSTDRALKILDRLRPFWTWSGSKAGVFERNINLLLDYQREHGDCLVPTKYKTQTGVNLGDWLNRMRQMGREKRLTTEHHARLEAVPSFCFDQVGEQTRLNRERVIRFIRQHGRLPGSEDCDDDGFQLGRWVQWKRGSYNAGRMLPEDIAAFETIEGWVWRLPHRSASVRKSLAERAARDPSNWQDRRLLTIAECRFLTDARSDHKTGAIPAGVKEFLESLPEWSWEKLESRWSAWYEKAMLACKERNGLPKPHGSTLWRWITRQRRRAKNGEMPPDRLAMLEKLPGWTIEHVNHRTPGKRDASNPRWLASYEKIKRRLERLTMADIYKDGDPAYSFIRGACEVFGEGKLSSEAIRLLEALPGWTWKPRADTSKADRIWREKYEKAIRHVKTTKSAPLARGTKCMPWIARNRNLQKSGKLLPDRAALFAVLYSALLEAQEKYGRNVG